MTLEHLKRLELLKTLIALEEKELLLSQVEKLEDEVDLEAYQKRKNEETVSLASLLEGES